MNMTNSGAAAVASNCECAFTRPPRGSSPGWSPGVALRICEVRGQCWGRCLVVEMPVRKPVSHVSRPGFATGSSC